VLDLRIAPALQEAALDVQRETGRQLPHSLPDAFAHLLIELRRALTQLLELCGGDPITSGCAQSAAIADQVEHGIICQHIEPATQTAAFGFVLRPALDRAHHGILG